MIYCKKDNLSRYLGINVHLDTAIRYIEQNDLSALPMGRNPIDGDAVYLNHFTYDTQPEENLLYESHADYADIHLLISGHERILCAQQSELTQVESDPASDYTGLAGTARADFAMTPADVLIVFAQEAHKVKCADAAGTCPVNKAVVKVRL